MFFSLLFYGFLLYILYRLVFHFILPIYKTTKQVKRSFRDMQDRMNQHTNAGGGPQQPGNAAFKKPSNSNAKAGDYIDFEEVKE